MAIITFCFFFLQTNSNPSIKETTALELYVLTCLGFVFAAILELAIVLLLPTSRKTNTKIVKKENGRKSTASENFLENVAAPCMEPEDLTVDEISRKPLYKFEITQSRLDRVTCVAFGVLFIMFNVMYWIYYFL